MNIPLYNNIDLVNTKLLCGFYSLGMIEQYFPDIKVIDACYWRLNGSSDRHGNNGYDWLHREILTYIDSGKTVLVIPEDEEVMSPPDERLNSVLNLFINSDVYFVTQMPHFGIYIDAGIRCKILELPWMMVNDCMCFNYINVDEIDTEINNYHHNYMSFVGRPQQHKVFLLEYLHHMNLSENGLLTVMGEDDLSSHMKEYCVVNPIPPYSDYTVYQYDTTTCHELYDDNIIGFKEGGFHSINGIWVSANVMNFIQIHKTFHNIPLVVHCETTTGIFPMTEKSVWPILLGKLFLIHGHKGVMAEIQRFYNIDITKFANLEFDEMQDGWDSESDELRVKNMVNDNIDLINDASNLYDKLKPELNKAKYTFGENMYNFFISQLNTIHTKEIR
jgi:hypothetical protein